MMELLRDRLINDGRRTWTICTTRKLMLCVYCGESIAAKSQAYRPVGNGMDRQDRLHEECGQMLARELAGLTNA